MHAWSKLLNNKTERFGIWLNIVDPATYTSKVPFMYPNIFKRWLLATRDVTDSCFINGLNSRLNRSGEEGRLNAFSTYPMVWLQSRLLWNPEYSVDELLNVSPALRNIGGLFSGETGSTPVFFRNPRASINMPIIFRNITAEVFQRNRRSPTGRSSPWHPWWNVNGAVPPKRQRPCRCSAAAVSCFSGWKCRMRPRKMNSAYLRPGRFRCRTEKLRAQCQ